MASVSAVKAGASYSVIVPIVIDPSAATVTAIVALFAPSVTVINALPSPTEVIATFPPTIAAVATSLSSEDAEVPIKPKVSTSFAVVASVSAVKGSLKSMLIFGVTKSASAPVTLATAIVNVNADTS